ncbi:MAG: ABC transporter substrate-binding protein [Alphaproteobacteria bacterium]|nr:ABC transporter substrate-binding protein [Alphaproteobacteria bacterium]
MRKPILLAAAMMIAVASNVRAADPGADIGRAASDLASGVVAAAKSEAPGERLRLLREAARPILDMRAIGEGVLAYAGAKVPPTRQAEVLEQVIAYVGGRIIQEIERIRPETANLGAAEFKDDKDAQIMMSLMGPRDSIDVRWYFRKSGEGWRIVDGEVSGSRLTAYFGEQLARYAHGVDQLVDYLRAQQKRSQTAANT